MIKQNIVDNVSANTGLTKVEVEAVLNESFSQIINALSKNERIELRGFGTFRKKMNKAKFVRNPKTNEKIFKGASNKIHFKIGKILHHKINKDNHLNNE